eukprot:COSAG06_NODE_24280_length_667_cov_1.075704_1_plen_81_part_10
MTPTPKSAGAAGTVKETPTETAAATGTGWSEDTYSIPDGFDEVAAATAAQAQFTEDEAAIQAEEAALAAEEAAIEAQIRAE